jgi:hypothetical protein
MLRVTTAHNLVVQESKEVKNIGGLGKALHSELLTKLLGRFPSRNEYFVISEVRIVRHFFEVFGKFGISQTVWVCSRVFFPEKLC